MAIFDAIADAYDGWYESRKGKFVDRVETELAFRLFRAQEGMRILDVGCGTGNFSIKLAQMRCKVTGVDVSDRMLDVARKKAEKTSCDVDFRNMNVYDLKFEDDYFDGVFSMAAFEFVTQPEKALDELMRVVRRGGQVLVGTISRDSSWGQLYLSPEYQQDSIFKYAHFKTLEEMKAWKSEKLLDAGECLFIPPDSDEEEFNMHNERKLAGTVRGGYICALWRK